NDDLPNAKPRKLGGGSRSQPPPGEGTAGLAVRETSELIQSKAPIDLPFVELLAKSNFSFLQGASHPEEMVLQAQALGYRGLALCDANGLYGVVRGWQSIEFPSHFTAH